MATKKAMKCYRVVATITLDRWLGPMDHEPTEEEMQRPFSKYEEADMRMADYKVDEAVAPKDCPEDPTPSEDDGEEN